MFQLANRRYPNLCRNESAHGANLKKNIYDEHRMFSETRLWHQDHVALLSVVGARGGYTVYTWDKNTINFLASATPAPIMLKICPRVSFATQIMCGKFRKNSAR